MKILPVIWQFPRKNAFLENVQQSCFVWEEKCEVGCQNAVLDVAQNLAVFVGIKLRKYVVVFLQKRCHNVLCLNVLLLIRKPYVYQLCDKLWFFNMCPRPPKFAFHLKCIFKRQRATTHCRGNFAARIWQKARTTNCGSSSKLLKITLNQS